MKISLKNRVRTVFVLTLLETLVIFIAALFLIIKNFTATNTSDQKALMGEIAYAFIGFVIFAFLSNGIRKNRRVTYAPLILLNLIFLGVAKYMIDASMWIGAVPLILIAITLVFLVGSMVNE